MYMLVKVTQVPHTFGLLRCRGGEADGTSAVITGIIACTALPVAEVFYVHAQLRGPLPAWRHHCHLCHIENVPIICPIQLAQHRDAKADKSNI